MMKQKDENIPDETKGAPIPKRKGMNGGNITININGMSLEDDEPSAPMPMPEPEPESKSARDKVEYKSSWWGRRRALRSEKAIQKATLSAQNKTLGWEKKIMDIRDETDRKAEEQRKAIMEDGVSPYCARHPKLCSIVGKGPKSKKDTTDDEIETSKESETVKDTKSAETNNTKTNTKTDTKTNTKTSASKKNKKFCEKHPKACKAGKLALAAGTIAAAGALAVVDPVGAGVAAGSMLPTPTRRKKASSQNNQPAMPKKAPVRAKASTSTPKTRKSPSKPVSKPKKAVSKAKTVKSTAKTKTTAKKPVKKKPAKKSSRSSWWGDGDAGL